ncbi:hypothetical protein HK097_010910, partial [Rhizophlyctis rosea]
MLSAVSRFRTGVLTSQRMLNTRLFPIRSLAPSHFKPASRIIRSFRTTPHSLLSHSIKYTTELSDKVQITLAEHEADIGHDLDVNRPPTEVKQRVGHEFAAEHLLNWSQTPRTVLIVKKPNDDRT